jgi:hypothetical protein
MSTHKFAAGDCYVVAWDDGSIGGPNKVLRRDGSTYVVLIGVPNPVAHQPTTVDESEFNVKSNHRYERVACP